MPVQSVDLPPDFDLLALHAADPGRYPALLESVATVRDGDAGAFDILFACPGDCLCLAADFTLRGPGAAGQPRFLDALDAWWRLEGQPASHPAGDSGLPFTGGWFLFLGYELVAEIEPRVPVRAPAAGPVAFALRVPAAILRRRGTGEAWLVAEDAAAATTVARDIEAALARPPPPVPAQPLVQSVTEPDPAEFESAVLAVRRLIAEGEVYQVNLARQWRALLRPGSSAVELYRRLRRTNPAPYAGIVQRDGWAVVSSSPERLIRRRGDDLDTRPIAGTRPRAADPGGEDAVRRDLLANPKERAEHVMLIDLERNDLGRVSVAGSVVVDEHMVVETYSHVHHIVSNIRGRARAGLTPGGLVRALFPGGTITGCPKVRCLEIIAGLEQEPRGAYTGSMGYLNRDGSCDLNILIRSFVVQGQDATFAAGSGIVADSTPERELAETRAKAKGLLLALEDER